MRIVIEVLQLKESKNALQIVCILSIFLYVPFFIRPKNSKPPLQSWSIKGEQVKVTCDSSPCEAAAMFGALFKWDKPPGYRAKNPKAIIFQPFVSSSEHRAKCSSSDPGFLIKFYNW